MEIPHSDYYGSGGMPGYYNDGPYNHEGLPPIRRPFKREVGGFELDKADLDGHPAACPDDVMERLRAAALTLGLSVKVGATRLPASALRPRGIWQRYIEVTDERLPKAHQVQVTTLSDDETWANAAQRIGLWPTR